MLNDQADIEAFRAQKVKDDEKKVANATYTRGYVWLNQLPQKICRYGLAFIGVWLFLNF